MTYITVYKSEGEVDFHAKGHCLAGDGGRDLVCAAVSMLACTLMERLEKLEVGMSELHVSYESGEVNVFAKAKTRQCARNLDECVETLMCGFRMISAAFPKNVHLTEREGRRGGADVEKA